MPLDGFSLARSERKLNAVGADVHPARAVDPLGFEMGSTADGADSIVRGGELGLVDPSLRYADIADDGVTACQHMGNLIVGATT